VFCFCCCWQWPESSFLFVASPYVFLALVFFFFSFLQVVNFYLLTYLFFYCIFPVAPASLPPRNAARYFCTHTLELWPSYSAHSSWRTLFLFPFNYFHFYFFFFIFVIQLKTWHLAEFWKNVSSELLFQEFLFFIFVVVVVFRLDSRVK
jgi:hypothetical protein